MQYHAMALLLNFEPFSQNYVLIPDHEVTFTLAVSHMLYICFCDLCSFKCTILLPFVNLMFLECTSSESEAHNFI